MLLSLWVVSGAQIKEMKNKNFSIKYLFTSLTPLIILYMFDNVAMTTLYVTKLHA